MRIVAVATLAFLLGTCVALTAPAPEPKDYQKIADQEAWEWSKEKASAEYCKKAYKGDYDVELLPSGGDGGGGSLNIRFLFQRQRGSLHRRTRGHRFRRAQKRRVLRRFYSV
ncbi:MAG TPA: hypothetical protein VGG61_01245 [Gemmataceae bacterium]